MAGPGALEARARKRLGTTLRGKYRLDRLLGVGGMASVYAATHRNSKRFAVKVLHPELSIHDDVRARFLREGYAANRVAHPGAVAVLDDDLAEDGSAFLVMDLFDGQTVDVIWECHQKRLTCGVVLCAARQILAVLAAAHAQHVVHRDIKPANLLVTREGDVKILDFGIARLRDAPGVTTTRAGVVLGTPAFMSPEQALARPGDLDGSSDVWAVGATMFTLLSGEHVHEGDSSHQVMIHAATRPARSLADVEPDLPPAVIALVDRALAFAREDRWPSADAMGDEVEAVHVALSGEPTSRAPLAAVVVATELRLTEGAGAGSLSPMSASDPSGRKAAATTAQPLVFRERAARLARSSRARRIAVGLALGTATSAVIVAAGVRPRAQDAPVPAAGGAMVMTPPVAPSPFPIPNASAPEPVAPPPIAAPPAPVAPGAPSASIASSPRRSADAKVKSVDAGSPSPEALPNRRDPLAP
jgi:serine/threonine-protein kinase